jgi:hypothetical protein
MQLRCDICDYDPHHSGVSIFHSGTHTKGMAYKRQVTFDKKTNKYYCGGCVSHINTGIEEWINIGEDETVDVTLSKYNSLAVSVRNEQ